MTHSSIRYQYSMLGDVRISEFSRSFELSDEDTDEISLRRPLLTELYLALHSVGILRVGLVFSLSDMK